MSFSFFDPAFEAMGSLLAWLYGVIPNYGIAIILLTMLVRLVLYPLTAKQARSMIAMQRVQPEIKRLQAKHKGDRQKLNEEMMKFYKENKINPFGGCLPLIAQMPIFISLFRVLNDPRRYVPKGSAFYQNLCGSEVCGIDGATVSMPFLGMDLALRASDNHGSFAASLPYWLLIAAVAITTFFQQRQTMRNNPNPNPQAQMIGRIMPVVFAFISINLPAGVVLYFFISNLWQMGQQEVIIRRLNAEPVGTGAKGGGIDAKSSETSTAGGLLARLTGARGSVNEPEAPGSDSTDEKSDRGAAAPKKGSGTKRAKAGGTNRPGSGTKGSKSSQSAKGTGKGGGSSGSGGKPQQSTRRRKNKKRRR